MENSWYEHIRWERGDLLFPGDKTTAASDQLLPWKCISEIVPGLLLTCEELLSDRENCIKRGISLVVNLCGADYVAPFKMHQIVDGVSKTRRIESVEVFAAELNAYTSKPLPPTANERKVFIRTIPALDVPSYDIGVHFPELCSLLEMVFQNREILEGSEADLHNVGVHCMVGVSRSASAVIAYLMKKTGLPRDDILSFVRTSRPVVGPNPGFMAQLALWELLDCYRIVDETSAEMVSTEVKRKRNIVEFVSNILPVLLRNNKCALDREFFGYVVHAGQMSENDLIEVFRELRSFVTAAIDSEIYADVPNFFGYVCELVSSLERHCGEMMRHMRVNETDHTTNDAFYDRMIRVLGRSGFEKDTYDTVRAFCSLLEMIHVKHIREQPAFCDEPTLPFPPHIALSFPFLCLMAPYAEGFVEFRQLQAVREAYPAGLLTAAAALDLSEQMTHLFSSSFLMTTTGALQEESVGAPVTTAGRWNDKSRLMHLKKDVEAEVFDHMERDVTAPLDWARYYEGVTDPLVARLIARKVVSGVVAYRLLLEAVETFVLQVYKDQVKPSDLSIASRLPLNVVQGTINAIETHFEEAFHTTAGVRAYFHEELEPLQQNGVVTSSGVWLLFSE
ncbi:dual-specificity protein phosphatase [Strigomonas culicis]|uniref:Dual-specificity protein phosphatase n=1 Tax=Strigomonas culicis TaxID=28005 RepID=S9VXN7_9TRYP|nr:dual-specificity protein phosphatase [Strigomonas culicis]|eukprot:EPY28410.1 dual-specificity protein phosphatase [Strigomonas culicis]